MTVLSFGISKAHNAAAQDLDALLASVATMAGGVRVTSSPYNADPTGVLDATAAFQAANAYAASLTPPAALVIPRGTYKLSGVGPILSLVDDQHITGEGMPLLNFGGSGALFNVAGKQRIEIDHLQIVGTFTANTWAIRHAASGTGAIGNHYHHLKILSFGDLTGTSGAGIQIDSDSANNEYGPMLFMGNLRANIAITAPTDSVRIHHNVLSTPTAHPLGPTRAVDASGGGGASGMVIDNNNCTSEGLGTFRINGGNWTLRDNDVETTHPIVNASNAACEILASAVRLERNSFNLHSQAGANYCVFFADGVGGSGESYGIYSGYLTKAVRVNVTGKNTYGPSDASTGANDLYSGDAAGIVMNQTPSGAPGQSQGFATAPTSGFGRNGSCWDGPTNLMATETGGNNALVTAGPVALVAGLRITVPLNHSLQAGANTLNYNGGGALAIKSIRNPANDIGAAYVAGGFVTLLYDGVSKWLDVSQ